MVVGRLQLERSLPLQSVDRSMASWLLMPIRLSLSNHHFNSWRANPWNGIRDLSRKYACSIAIPGIPRLKRGAYSLNIGKRELSLDEPTTSLHSLVMERFRQVKKDCAVELNYCALRSMGITDPNGFHLATWNEATCGKLNLEQNSLSSPSQYMYM